MEDPISITWLPTFTIKSLGAGTGFYTFTFEEGMTWGEFISSPYNKGATFYADGEFVGISDGSVGYGFSDSTPTPRLSDPIVPGQTYITYHAECVSPNSIIQTSLDTNKKYAKDIVEGDDIVYYNHQTNKEEVGTVSKVYIHKDASNFVRYSFEDGTYLEATDYHPIYTKEGWKSYTRRNGYEVTKIGDEVKTPTGWKQLTKIETYNGLEDFYDFAVVSKNGERVDNYFANGTLVQSSL